MEEEGPKSPSWGAATTDLKEDELRFVTFEEVFECASNDGLCPKIRAKYVDLMIARSVTSVDMIITWGVRQVNNVENLIQLLVM